MCSSAHMTTGALYFFFRDKADVYDAIVGETALEAQEIIRNMARREISEEDDIADVSASVKLGESLVNLYYNHPVEAKLLLECSQGSHYEGFREMLRDSIESRLRKLIDHRIKGEGETFVYDDKMIDWMTQMEVDGMLYALSISQSREEALSFIKKTVLFQKAGFNRLYRFEKSLKRKKETE